MKHTGHIENDNCRVAHYTPYPFILQITRFFSLSFVYSDSNFVVYTYLLRAVVAWAGTFSSCLNIRRVSNWYLGRFRLVIYSPAKTNFFFCLERELLFIFREEELEKTITYRWNAWLWCKIRRRCNNKNKK